MKRIILGISIASICLGSCVTKQKYVECTTDLSNCETERKELSTQKLNLENKVLELETLLKKTQAQVRQLEEDTTLLGRLVKEMKRNYASLQANYDDLTG